MDRGVRRPVDRETLSAEILKEEEKIQSLRASIHDIAENVKRELDSAKSEGLELDERLRQAEFELEAAEYEQQKAFREEKLLIDDIEQLEAKLKTPLPLRSEISFETWPGEPLQETDLGSKDDTQVSDSGLKTSHLTF